MRIWHNEDDAADPVYLGVILIGVAVVFLAIGGGEEVT